MSLDFNCYLSAMPDLSATDFDRFTSDRHFQVHIDPKIHLRDHAGFVPFSIHTDFLSATVQDCLSGFELYSMQMASGEGEIPELSGRTVSMLMCCQEIDSFETLLVYLFSAYLVDRCQAVFYDPQNDIFITDRFTLLNKAYECVRELQEADLQNELLTHPFVTFG